MNNRRIIISAESKKPQEIILGMSHLDGGRIKAHVPGMAAKLRGVITNVPLEMSMEEVKKMIKGGKVIDAKRLQTN